MNRYPEASRKMSVRKWVRQFVGKDFEEICFTFKDLSFKARAPTEALACAKKTILLSLEAWVSTQVRLSNKSVFGD
jgi:hypothetical protein